MKIKFKPKDIPNLDKDQVGDYYNKIWRGVGSRQPKKGKGSFNRKEKYRNKDF